MSMLDTHRHNRGKFYFHFIDPSNTKIPHEIEFHNQKSWTTTFKLNLFVYYSFPGSHKKWKKN